MKAHHPIRVLHQIPRNTAFLETYSPKKNKADRKEWRGIRNSFKQGEDIEQARKAHAKAPPGKEGIRWPNASFAYYRSREATRFRGIDN